MTGGRTTTFLGLRIVYLPGHNSLGSDAIWPIAIIERPEKRGPLRLYTRELRLQLAHAQASGVLLPPEYVSALDQDATPSAASSPAPNSLAPPQPDAARFPPPLAPDAETDNLAVAKFLKMATRERARRKKLKQRRDRRWSRRSQAGHYIVCVPFPFTLFSRP